MTTISDELENHFRDWRTYYGSIPFVADGLVGTEQQWLKAKPRILFLLKEPHDRNGVLQACGYDLRELFRRPQDFPQSRKTVERRLASCAVDIFALRTSDQVQVDDAIRRVAVMNLNKRPGGAKTISSTLTEVACRERYFIAKQVEILNPELVVCGGTLRFALKAVSGMASLAGSEELLYRRNGVVWVNHYHPAAPSFPHQHARVRNALKMHWRAET